MDFYDIALVQPVKRTAHPRQGWTLLRLDSIAVRNTGTTSRKLIGSFLAARKDAVWAEKKRKQYSCCYAPHMTGGVPHRTAKVARVDIVSKARKVR